MTVPVPDTPASRSALPPPGADPEWYKRAVFYEVLVRGFADSNADGVGDLRGMTDKLDYLQWLGVDCLWLPPFFASPLRDGGYDVSDYTAVLPEFGDIQDFKEFLDEAHARGMRVIIDFVMNHTSDQHPWFQASRSDPDGDYGDFYVWADDDSGYSDARIIFVDTESSNWTFDPVRKQYFWHRFFSHQPDLNFENPRVQDAIIEALRFWLDIGIDGFRLDAVPYLFEEEGTNCENLPKTHDFLKHVRKVVDADYPDTVLLCEANQWPADVVEYFGQDGDECQMAFHFPVMPRLFMGVRREQRFPISEIMAQTPKIPENCQWGVFLRNHDELTLEMVTDEERDYMWGEYAKDPRMKANIGIRRRLAPLLDNDTNTLELFNALLLSLPGSPVLYYGDEIGMGDNIWLGDRDGVRTPMQWTPDRNGGFSTADPQRMYLPLNQDPVYGYQVTNVESQLRNTNSLLQWVRRMIQVRNQHPTFGLGTYEEVGSRNPTVLSFVREFGDDVVLCVNNLSRFPQPVELDLRRFEGYTPVELTGRVEFPQIGVLPYMLTLAGHGFYWFELAKPAEPAEEPMEEDDTAVADSLLAAGVVGTGEESPSGHDRRGGCPMSALAGLLREWMPHQRWFGGKGREWADVEEESFFLDRSHPVLSIHRVTVSYADGASDTYLVPLSWRDHPVDELSSALVGAIPHQGSETYAYDAMRDRDATSVWLTHLAEGATVGPLRFVPAEGADIPAGLPGDVISTEQSNTSLVYGQEAILKLFRRLEPGLNPDVEVHAALRQTDNPLHRAAAGARRDRQPEGHGPGHR